MLLPPDDDSLASLASREKIVKVKDAKTED